MPQGPWGGYPWGKQTSAVGGPSSCPMTPILGGRVHLTRTSSTRSMGQFRQLQHPPQEKAYFREDTDDSTLFSVVGVPSLRQNIKTALSLQRNHLWSCQNNLQGCNHFPRRMRYNLLAKFAPVWKKGPLTNRILSFCRTVTKGTREHLTKSESFDRYFSA